MPVPSAISDLSQTAGSNSPAGSESPATTDDFFRAHASFIAELRDGQGYSAEVDVASAATCDIGGAASFLVRITGTTTITSFGTNYNGPRFVRFGGALTLTHHATTLILPGAANITTVAGDRALVCPVGDPGAGWQVLDYIRASGAPLLLADSSVATAKVADTAITAPKLSGAQTGSAPIFGARAWINFDGTTNTIRGSGNVDSITDNGTGDYTINFTTAMPDANYAVLTLSDIEEGAVRNNHAVVSIHTRSTTSVRILTSSSAAAAQDQALICLAIFR